MCEAIVRQHYNDRMPQTRADRQWSPVLGVRLVNNWVKAVLLADHATPAGRVLDLCGGRGGDLQKWAHAGATHVTLVDVAAAEIERARDRYASSAQRVASAHFIVGDVFAPSSPEFGTLFEYDTVACHFALHYACDAASTVQRFFDRCARALRTGGTLLCTFCDETRVRQMAAARNSVCRVQFEAADAQLVEWGRTFGIGYRFSLGDAISDCPEWIVPLDAVVACAQRAGFDVVRCETFDHLCHTAFATHATLYASMVGSTVLDADQWAVIAMYRACVFRRRREPPALPSEATPPIPPPVPIVSSHDRSVRVYDVFHEWPGRESGRHLLGGTNAV